MAENGKLWFSWFTSLWLSATTGRGPLPATFQSYKSIIILLWWGFIMLRNDFILLSFQIPLNHRIGWFLSSQRTWCLRLSLQCWRVTKYKLTFFIISWYSFCRLILFIFADILNHCTVWFISIRRTHLKLKNITVQWWRVTRY